MLAVVSTLLIGLSAILLGHLFMIVQYGSFEILEPNKSILATEILLVMFVLAVGLAALAMALRRN